MATYQYGFTASLLRILSTILFLLGKNTLCLVCLFLADYGSLYKVVRKVKKL